MIIVNNTSAQELHRYYRDVQVVGRMDHPLAMPYERHNIYLVRGRLVPLGPDWAESKHYI